jgi:Winged helix-turn helix
MMSSHVVVMEKEDARYQTLEQLHERRKQVVRLHKKAVKVMQIVAMTGMSYPTVPIVSGCIG